MKKGEKTRRKLLETAARIVEREGVTGLTLRRLASETGVSSGLIPRYFPKFDEVFEATVFYVFARSTEEIRIEGREEAAIEKLIGSMRRSCEFFILHYPHYEKVVLASNHYLGINPRLTRHREKMVQTSVARIDLFLHEHARDVGAVLTNEESLAFATNLLYSLEAAQNQSALIKTKTRKKKYIENFLQSQKMIIDRFVRP